MIEVPFESRRAEEHPPFFPRDEDTLSLAEVLRILRRRIRLIVAVVIGVLGLGVGYSVLQPPAYQASALVVISQTRPTDPQAGEQGIQFEVEGLKALAPTMAETVVSRPVVEAAIADLRLAAPPAEVSRRLQAEPVANTLFIRISYTDEEPFTALRFVNAVSSRFAASVATLDPLASPIRARVWQRAAPPTASVGLGLGVTGVLALMTGVVLGVAAAFLVEALRNAGILRRRAR